MVVGVHNEGHSDYFMHGVTSVDNPLPVDRALRQRQHMAQDVVDVEQLLVRFFLVEQRPDAGDDLARAVAVFNNAFRRLARIVDERRLPNQ